MKLNKYICLFVCILCATTTSFAKKNKTSEKVEQTVAEEVVEETTTEEVAAEEAPAVETPAEASEVSAEEVAAEPAPAEETVADATATEEVAEASEDAVEESEEVSDDDDEEVVEKKSKKKKKKSKKKKSKKKKKKKHSDDDEDSDEGAIGVKLGFHAGLGSNVLELEHGANASLNLGLGFAYFFTNNMAIVSGVDLSTMVTQVKVSEYVGLSGWTPVYEERTKTNAAMSIVVPLKFRYVFGDSFWAEAGTSVSMSVYGLSLDSWNGYTTNYATGVGNFTVGVGTYLGGNSIGLEIGYYDTLSLGVTFTTGF